MEQLPTKEQILRKHYFNYYRQSFPSDERTNEVVDIALSVKEEKACILAAMEEYAAVRAMPLVDLIREMKDYIVWCEQSPERSDAEGRGFKLSRKVNSMLSSYTGEQKSSALLAAENLEKETDYFMGNASYMQFEEEAKRWWRENIGHEYPYHFSEHVWKLLSSKNNETGEQPASGWIPLKEYYLENGQDFLLLYDDGSVSRRDEEDQPFAVVTHYMHIPPPPKAGEQPLKSEG